MLFLFFFSSLFFPSFLLRRLFTSLSLQMLFLALLVAAVSASTLCDTARTQWAQLGSSTRNGVLIDNPGLSYDENAAAQRRFRVLKATIARCSTPDGSKPYRKPYNGRRTIIHRRNGRRQYAVRRANGRFADIQDIGESSRRDQRRTRLQTADRIERPVAQVDEY